MQAQVADQSKSQRFSPVSQEKAAGATYTPKVLADFVATQIVKALDQGDQPTRILDPALGNGVLVESLLAQMQTGNGSSVEVHGFETDQAALREATDRIHQRFPNVSVDFRLMSFLEFVRDEFGTEGNLSLFASSAPMAYDAIIANPPYVRTQIIGARQAQMLARQFGLSGRTDLYHAFLVAIAQVMTPSAIAGIIVSNRFMSTKSGASVRRALRERVRALHIWDLGDTKLFKAAVLPAVLLLKGDSGVRSAPPRFTSIYETRHACEQHAANPIDALEMSGRVELDDGRRFRVRQGKLDVTTGYDGVWRIARGASESWLQRVDAHTWGTFRDVSKVRVGVKTCTDHVFIRSDWSDMALPKLPELLRPLTTHHVARRFRPLQSDNQRKILYPHEVVEGKRRAVDLALHPRSRAYLEENRSALESRTYVLEAGRQWYEIWVPQDPAAWQSLKLVFRDISERPTFWIDKESTVVNGDCYWMATKSDEQDRLLWLAMAVANSTLVEAYYDLRFTNKLYSGRRRFITQYVEQFPLPDPDSAASRDLVAMAREMFDIAGTVDADDLESRLDARVWEAFGLSSKEVGWQRDL